MTTPLAPKGSKRSKENLGSGCGGMSMASGWIGTGRRQQPRSTNWIYLGDLFLNDPISYGNHSRSFPPFCVLLLFHELLQRGHGTPWNSDPSSQILVPRRNPSPRKGFLASLGAVPSSPRPLPFSHLCSACPIHGVKNWDSFGINPVESSSLF